MHFHKPGDPDPSGFSADDSALIDPGPAPSGNSSSGAGPSGNGGDPSGGVGGTFTIGGLGGITFINTYDETVSQAYINCITAAENIFAGTFTDHVTIKLSFT